MGSTLDHALSRMQPHRSQRRELPKTAEFGVCKKRQGCAEIAHDRRSLRPSDRRKKAGCRRSAECKSRDHPAMGQTNFSPGLAVDGAGLGALGQIGPVMDRSARSRDHPTTGRTNFPRGTDRPDWPDQNHTVHTSCLLTRSCAIYDIDHAEPKAGSCAGSMAGLGRRAESGTLDYRRRNRQSRSLPGPSSQTATFSQPSSASALTRPPGS